MRPSQPILAASVAVFRDGRALVARRANPPAAGLYSLPGGRVEPGERLEDAALRELLEEVGVRAAIVGFNRHVEMIARAPDGAVSRHIVVASFVADWLSGEGEAGPEAIEPRWVAPDEVTGLAATPHLDGVVADAFAIWRRARGLA